MLEIVGITSQDSCYVWDTDDLTIEKVSNYDVLKSAKLGVDIHNFTDSGIGMAKLDDEVRVRLMGRRTHLLSRDDDPKHRRLEQIPVDEPDLLVHAERVLRDNICYVIPESWAGKYVTVWHEGYLYQIPSHIRWVVGDKVHRDTTTFYAIGTYRGAVKIVRANLTHGFSGGITLKDDKITITGKKYSIEDSKSYKMSRLIFNRKVLMGVFD